MLTPAHAPRAVVGSRSRTLALPRCPRTRSRQKKLQKKLQREQQRIRRLEAQGGGRAEPAKDAPKPSKAAPKDEPSDDDEGIDDDDLIASTVGMEASPSQQQQQPGGPGPFAPPSVMASVSCGLSRAAVALQRTFHAAAVRAPPRRQLTRPQRSEQ